MIDTVTMQEKEKVIELSHLFPLFKEKVLDQQQLLIQNHLGGMEGNRGEGKEIQDDFYSSQMKGNINDLPQNYFSNSSSPYNPPYNPHNPPYNPSSYHSSSSSFSKNEKKEVNRLKEEIIRIDEEEERGGGGGGRERGEEDEYSENKIEYASEIDYQNDLEEASKEIGEHANPFLLQFYYISKRTLKHISRNPYLLRLQYIMTFVISFFLGFSFFVLFYFILFYSYFILSFSKIFCLKK